MSVAILQPDGSYGAVIVSGANLSLDPALCRRGLEQLGGAAVLVLQNEVPAEVNAGVAQAAGGAHVILNAAPARAPSADLFDHVDTLVVNRVEAEMIAGLTVATLADARAALPALGASKRNVIITLGGDGLVLQPRDGAPLDIAPHRVKPVSTHGAGDCFIGALASRLARHETLADAAAFANRAAATFVSLSGAERTNFGSTMVMS